MTDQLIQDLQKRMEASVEVLKKEFSGLRTGRASISLLDPIHVDAYGSKMPLNQVGTVSAPEARMLSVQVWDQGMVTAVEKAIRESDLGLNPSSDGNLIRIPLPDLSEERRKELVKVAAKYAEQSRISIRNIRRDGIESVRKMEKDGEISEDDKHHLQDEVQKVTDSEIKKVDELLAHKEKDIMTV